MCGIVCNCWICIEMESGMIMLPWEREEEGSLGFEIAAAAFPSSRHGNATQFEYA